jgi:hypothetical protein
MIQLQHVEKGKLKKSILKANMDTVFCLIQLIAEHNNGLDTEIFYFSSNFNAAFFFELIGTRALVVCVLISKFELSYFTPNINAVFLQNDPPYGSLMDHKKLLFHFG